MTATPDLQAALRAVTLAGEVERHARGVGRVKLRELADITDARILEAVHAGATVNDIAAALYVGASRADQRIRRAKRAAGEWGRRTPRPKGVTTGDTPHVAATLAPSPAPVTPADVWLEVPRCGAPLPPPWPVWARCSADHGHIGDHTHGS